MNKRKGRKTAKSKLPQKNAKGASGNRKRSIKPRTAQAAHFQDRANVAREMLDANPDRMSLVDLDYIYRDVNRAYLETHHCTREEIVGKHLADVLGREIFERTVKPHYDRCLTGKQVRYESWFDFPTGRQYVDVIYNPHYDRSGDVTGVIVTARDITQVQLAREELQFAGDCLNVIGANADDIVWIDDANTEKTLFASGAFERIWGRPLDELYQNPNIWMESIHPDDRPRVAVGIKRLRLHERMEIEYRIVRPDGEIRWIRDHGVSVYDARNQVHRNVGVAQDITELKRRDEAVAAERRRLNAFLNNSLLNAWMKDEDGKYVYWSNQAQACFKEKGNSWEGKTDFDLWPHEVAKSLRRNDLAVLEGGEAIEAVEQIPKADGTVSWWMSNKFLFEDEDGKRYVGGLGVDITALKQAQAAAEFERRRLDAFLNNSLVYGWMKDEEGRLVYLSANCEKRYGVRFEDWKGKKDIEIWPHEIAEEFRRNDQVVLRAGQPIETVERTPHPDGSDSWFLNNKFPFQDQEGRRYVGGLGVDITKMRQAEAERQTFVLLADQSHEFVGICDCQFKPFYVNPSGRRLVGLKDDDDIAQVSVPEFFFPEDLPLLMNEFFPRAQREGHAEVEIRFRHLKTGLPIWMLYHVFILRDSNDTQIGWATVSRDITGRRLAEESRRRLDAKAAHSRKLDAVGTLAAGMAHDVNTLLTVILGNTQLIQAQLRRSADKRNLDLMSEEVKAIVDAVDRGKTFLDKLLAFGRIRSSRLMPIDINAAVNDTLKVVKPIVGSSIVVQCRLASDLRPCVGDAVQMQQLLLNLIRNAADAMPNGGTLTIQTKNAVLADEKDLEEGNSSGHDFVCLTIVDTGVGMDKMTMEKLFEPYFSNKPLDKGTGLGLSIVYAIVAQAEGHITVESEVGRGSTFRVFMPAII